jgi:histidyl-tRNA synthetase
VSRIQAVKGMNDVLPSDTATWEHTARILANCLKQFAYQEIKLPLIEKTTLFKRTIGDVTDIVEKEMYTFTDLNNESISLRPEGTAGCVRAAIEHGLLRQVQKWWYMGPMFRHEKPQKGRYRQFHQLGVEVFGIADAAIDFELLILCHQFWQNLGIEKKLSLELNTIGTPLERQLYKVDLVKFFRQHVSLLTEEELQRLEKNPLRLLDSKSDSVKQLLKDAPQLINYISTDSKAAFDVVCKGLDELGIGYQFNPYLVRGLDYYNHLVFEWVTTELGSQATVCAGGRYDSLVEELGGPKVPAIGFALGLERLILLLNTTFGDFPVQVYVLTQEEQPLTQTQILANQIREFVGLNVEVHLSASSLKSQFKRADKSGAKIALILGENELQNQEVSVKLLRGDFEDDKQLILKRTEIISWLQQQHGEGIC